MASKPQIRINDVLSLLQKGYTRYEKDNTGRGSIQAHYGLNASDVTELFKNPKLKGKKTITPKENPFILIDDTGEEEVVVVGNEPVVEEPTPLSEDEARQLEAEHEAEMDALASQQEAEMAAQAQAEAEVEINEAAWDAIAEGAPEVAGPQSERE